MGGLDFRISGAVVVSTGRSISPLHSRASEPEEAQVAEAESEHSMSGH